MSRLAVHRFRAMIKFALAGLLATGFAVGTTTPTLASGSFTKTGSMNVARISHTATLLSNGEVLVAGGDNSGSAELYNPSTGSWTLTGSMTTARAGHQAVLLTSGEVLVAGGQNASGTLASAELYDPTTGTWTETGSMITPRYNFSLTRLTDGEVLAAQGTKAELYNPATGMWTATGNPAISVSGPNAALLLDGQVLAIGTSTEAELYNRSSGTWTATGSTGGAMVNPITALLPSGDVLVTGGFISGNRAESTAAVYDPSTAQFTFENGPCQCAGFKGVALQTGEALVAGGTIVIPGSPYPSYQTIKSAELWDPSTQAWTNTGNLNSSRSGETITLLENGEALVAGGSQSSKNSTGFVILATAELYKP